MKLLCKVKEKNRKTRDPIPHLWLDCDHGLQPNNRQELPDAYLLEKINKFHFKNQSCIRWNCAHTLIAISQTRWYDENTFFSLFH